MLPTNLFSTITFTSHYVVNKWGRQPYSKAQKDIDFTMEHEVEGKFYLLDIGIGRTSDGTLQRYIHRENT